MTDEKIEELIEEKIAGQYLLCRKNYYKSVLKTVIGGISTIVIILAGIIAWSYQPISDIQVLKLQMKVIDGKLDVILDNKGKEKIFDKRNSEPLGAILIVKRGKNGNRFTRGHE